MDLLCRVLKKYLEDKKDIEYRDNYLWKKNRKIKLEIREYDTWITLKKRIDIYCEYLNEYQLNCPYCYKNIYNKMDKKVYCQKCKLEYCLDCYIQKLKENKGIIDCFNCNYKFGNKCSESELIIKCELIKSKFNN